MIAVGTAVGTAVETGAEIAAEKAVDVFSELLGRYRERDSGRQIPLQSWDNHSL